MRFERREKTVIDAKLWTGGNAAAVNEFVLALVPRVSDAVLWLPRGPVATEQGTTELDLVALTLHGHVTVERGSWLAYGGTDFYPISDDEMQRLYRPVDAADAARVAFARLNDQVHDATEKEF